ncbi:MAG: hypothetical protein H5T33_00680 [Candidatus Methanosuratus sp.]|nr:hypothetical protein [Candidatus Methanosuratincola sp.]
MMLIDRLKYFNPTKALCSLEVFGLLYMEEDFDEWPEDEEDDEWPEDEEDDEWPEDEEDDLEEDEW